MSTVDIVAMVAVTLALIAVIIDCFRITSSNLSPTGEQEDGTYLRCGSF